MSSIVWPGMAWMATPPVTPKPPPAAPPPAPRAPASASRAALYTVVSCVAFVLLLLSWKSLMGGPPVRPGPNGVLLLGQSDLSDAEEEAAYDEAKLDDPDTEAAADIDLALGGGEEGEDVEVSDTDISSGDQGGVVEGDKSGGVEEGSLGVSATADRGGAGTGGGAATSGARTDTGSQGPLVDNATFTTEVEIYYLGPKGEKKSLYTAVHPGTPTSNLPGPHQPSPKTKTSATTGSIPPSLYHHLSVQNVAQQVFVRVIAPKGTDVLVDSNRLRGGTLLPPGAAEGGAAAGASEDVATGGSEKDLTRVQKISAAIPLSTMKDNRLRVQVITFVTQRSGTVEERSLEFSITRTRDCGQLDDCASRLCLEGTCRCPVLFRGDDDCSPTPVAQRWCLQPFQRVPLERLFVYAASPKHTQPSVSRFFRSYPKGIALDNFALNQGDPKGAQVAKANLARLPPHDITKVVDFSSCAVVGSSNVLLTGTKINDGDGKQRKLWGADIDAHTAVIRFNEAPTKGFEKFAGSKTSVRFQNPERVGFAEGPSEVCFAKMGRVSRKKTPCSIMQFSPQWEAYTRVLWKLYNPHGEKVDRTKFSSGFIGIAFAMHVCGSVDMYGFTHGTGYYFNKKVHTIKARMRRLLSTSRGETLGGETSSLFVAGRAEVDGGLSKRHTVMNGTARAGVNGMAGVGSRSKESDPWKRGVVKVGWNGLASGSFIVPMATRHPWKWEKICTAKLEELPGVKMHRP
eukprot:jgi/Mesvir1/27746/Mv07436-RA.1